MKKTIIIPTILLVLILAIFGLLTKGVDKNNFYGGAVPAGQKQEASKKEIWVGSNKILVEVAATNAERTKGLGGRDSLAENEGMLFIFEDPGFYSFWMKDMKFPLDFIWIQGNQVKEIMENIPPPKNSSEILPIYQAGEPVDKVLEVNAGWVKSHDIKVGDKIRD